MKETDIKETFLMLFEKLTEQDVRIKQLGLELSNLREELKKKDYIINKIKENSHYHSFITGISSEKTDFNDNY